MPDPTNPAPPAPPAPAPATPPPAAPTFDKEALTKAVSDALSASLPIALQTELKPISDSVGQLTQRLNDLEAAFKAAPGDANEPAALSAIRKELGEVTGKLSKRFGIEFAARAGANPVENPPGDDTKKAFETPARDVWGAQFNK